jgi:hypothetical protein
LTGDLYDHLIAVIVVSVLFIAAVVAVPNISYVNLLYMDQQQLRNIALATLKTMLLDVGYPTEWGSSTEFNASSIERFGLALEDSPSLYVLDSDKVQRLVVDNPVGYLEYDQVRELLGLEGYGFSLKIRAPFKVSIEDQSPSAITNLRYEVTVTSNDEKPLPNAIVDALIFYSLYKGGQNEDERYSVGYVEETVYTDEMGKCIIEKVLSGSVSDVIIVFKTTVGDVHSVVSVYRRGDPPADVAEINMVNDTIILTPPDSTPKDARWILNIATYSSDGVTSLYNGTQDDKINWGERDRWEKTFNNLKDTDPVIMIFNFRAVEKGVGRKGILMVGPYPNYLGSRVVEYDSGGSSPSEAGVQLQRSVSLSGMTYIVEFSLWKE